MSKNSFRRKVESQLKFSLEGSADYDVPIEYENVRFIAPNNAPYVAIHILEGKSFQTEISIRAVTRHPGVLQIDCLVPEDSASTYLDQLAEFVGKIFDRKSYILSDQARVVFRTPYFKYLGEYDGWCRNVVSIDYYRDEAPALPGE